jgi:hypothetical protein
MYLKWVKMTVEDDRDNSPLEGRRKKNIWLGEYIFCHTSNVRLVIKKQCATRQRKKHCFSRHYEGRLGHSTYRRATYTFTMLNDSQVPYCAGVSCKVSGTTSRSCFVEIMCSFTRTIMENQRHNRSRRFRTPTLLFHSAPQTTQTWRIGSA